MGKLKKCPACRKAHDKGGKYCSYSCAYPAVEDAVIQLKTKKGPIYEKWKRRLKASLKRL